MATGSVPARSDGSNARPDAIGTPIVSKYADEIAATLIRMVERPPGPSTSMACGRSAWSGHDVASATDSTPGIAATRGDTRSKKARRLAASG